MSDPIELRVRAGDCPCPGTPHTEEVLYLEPKLSNVMGQAGLSVMRDLRDTPGATTNDVEAELVSAWLPRGIRAWTFLEERDDAIQPVLINRETFEELVPFDKGGAELVTRVGSLWMERFLVPLGLSPSTSSLPTSTDDSISLTPPSGSNPPKQSRRSSQTNGAGRPSVVPAR